MKTVWFVLAAVLIVSMAVVVSADESAIPLYDGKPGKKVGDMRINPKDGAEMVWVPAGEFIMGSNDGFDDAKPQRNVHLDGYWVYKYPVTVAQYRKYCESTERNMPRPPLWGWQDNHPIVLVSWESAVDYAEWAGASLPTEAQWEKAARGTDGRTYPWGNDWDLTKFANSVEERLMSTQPVGSYPDGASPYGALDMVGNVWEFCSDWYGIEYYKSQPSSNPKGPDSGVARTARGGSWIFVDAKEDFRCFNRGAIAPNLRYDYYGFRCVVNP